MGTIPTFNRHWLDSIGYTGLTDDQTKTLSDLARGELELRVGTRLADLLDTDQLQQADLIFDDDAPNVSQVRLDWLEASGLPIPDRILAIADNQGPHQALEALNHEIPSMWLEYTGLPYRDVVAATAREITDEFRTDREAIMARLTAQDH